MYRKPSSDVKEWVVKFNHRTFDILDKIVLDVTTENPLPSHCVPRERMEEYFTDILSRFSEREKTVYVVEKILKKFGYHVTVFDSLAFGGYAIAFLEF